MKRREEVKLSKFGAFLLSLFYCFLFFLILFVGYYFYTDLYVIYILNNNVNMDVGKSYQIELRPKNVKYFDYRNYYYEPVDSSVVTVEEGGKITALKEGTTQVAIRFKNGFWKKYLTVNVDSKNYDSTDINTSSYAEGAK